MMKLEVLGSEGGAVVARVEVDGLPRLIRYSLGEEPVRYATYDEARGSYVEAIPVNVVARRGIT